MSWLSTLLYGKDRGPSAAETRFNDDTARRGERSGQLEDEYLAADKAFDPDAAFKTYSAGAMGDFHTALAKELGALRESAAGGGRLNSGFFDEDQGRVVTDLGTQLQNNLNQKALEVAGMRQQQLRDRGAYAQNAQNNYYDMLSGQLDRETAKDNAKRQQRGAVLGAVGSIAGSIIGR